MAAVSLNVDYNEAGPGPDDDLRRQVQEKLASLGMSCQNVISSDPMNNVLEHFQVTFGLPAVLVFAPDGTLAKGFDGGPSYDQDVIPLVSQLLKSQHDASPDD